MARKSSRSRQPIPGDPGTTQEDSSTPRPPLTRRQRQILDFVHAYLERRGMSPTLEEIAQHFGVNKVTVFGHVGELERKGVIERSAPGVSRGLRLVGDSATPAPRARIPLRIMGTIAAGMPIEAVEDVEVFELDELVPPGADVYILRVRGDSMIEDAICDGDLVLVERCEQARNGQTVVAVIPDTYVQDGKRVSAGTSEQGEVTLKRFYREPDGVRLQPANAALEPIHIRSSDGEVTIRGVVIGVVRQLS